MPPKHTTKRRYQRQSRQALRFSPTAWAKLLFLRDIGDTEVGGFGISASDDLLLIQDFVLIPQVCSAVTVSFADDAVAEFFDQQVDLCRQPHEFARIWIHTHPGNCARPSAVDEETFSRVFGRSDWAVMAIVACGGETYARLQFQSGPGGSLRLPIEVSYAAPFMGSDHNDWTDEYLAAVHPISTLIVPEDTCFPTSSRVGGSSRSLSPLELAAWPDW